MTAESATDPAPISAADTVSHLANAVSRLHIDMQTSDPSELVRERILDESVEDGGDDDVGATLLDDEADGRDEDDKSNLDTEQQNAETLLTLSTTNGWQPHSRKSKRRYKCTANLAFIEKASSGFTRRTQFLLSRRLRQLVSTLLMCSIYFPSFSGFRTIYLAILTISTVNAEKH
ncbi:hypothetical protein B0H17DRAFT_1137394 [Mycena rosella]|uniref:Uncharacterized protein n=1 Tax=Mycena rosella TaxID=1033263 RepID=A0AAD7D8V1_MYCRO|nr:hypothetical protein B0H17DRAFT_1137394 [Mycena rosella]